ncbi:MAG: A/G-specific adenine glycosylase [Actinomycetes bacterium]
MSPDATPALSALSTQEALGAVVTWFEKSARTLPWRSDPEPWAVLVSEVMLQQTPVVRVLPAFERWMARWPTPNSLAADSPGEAIRAWGRLGYPRRALRLHAAAVTCRDHFGGAVPDEIADLRSLPGVGEYTAAAVAAFGFGQRRAVLDTNVRRVHARWLDGLDHPATATPRNDERERALALLPDDPSQAARVSISVMELGALVCTSRTPNCPRCPLLASCAWRAAGYPERSGRPRRQQGYEGTDRQCRGRLLDVLRSAASPVKKAELDNAWPDSNQRERALGSLIDDGLVTGAPTSGYRLPD